MPTADCILACEKIEAVWFPPEFSFGFRLENRRLFLFNRGESCRICEVNLPAGIDLFLTCLVDLAESRFVLVVLAFLLEVRQLPGLALSCGPPGVFLVHLAFGHSGLTSVLRKRIATIRSSALTLTHPEVLMHYHV